jgi:hypothetical protein
MLTNVELLALSRVLKESEEKRARSLVTSGSYSVDFKVHVVGVMNVEDDYEKRPTVSVPWTEAYALLREVAIQAVNEMIARVDRGEVITHQDLEAIKVAGFLSEQIMVETMKQAFDLKNAPRGEGSIMERIPEVEQAAERVKELIAGRLGLTPSKGRVKADLTFEPVSSFAPEGTASQPEIASETNVGKKTVFEIEASHPSS